MIRGRTRGFTLPELLIAISLSSVILAIILMAYRVSVDVFNSQLTDTNIWVELREASASISRDLRDANFVNASAGMLLVSFILESDGQMYSYYINSNNALVRQQGNSGSGGKVIAHNLDSLNTWVNQNGALIHVNLVVKNAENVARLTTSVKPRNW